MTEHEPDERERREAEALARALDGEHDADAPSDALESALLLRYARGEDQASPEQLARARQRAQVPSIVRKSRVRYALGAASLAVAASFMLVFVAQRSMAPMAERAAAPAQAPAISSLGLLIAAQGELLKSPEQPLAPLELATAHRRATLFAELDAHYGGSP